MLTRLSGGAQQPLADNHSMEGNNCSELYCMTFNLDSSIADIRRSFAKNPCCHLNLTNVPGNSAGLPMLPSFQSNTREGALPDMQVSGGNYGGPGE